MNIVQSLFLKAKKLVVGGLEEDLTKAPFVSAADCHACATPCQDEDHPHYPFNLKINHDMPLLYSVKPYTRHVLISTGVEDWPGHIDHDKSSLAHHLHRAIEEGQQRHPNSNGRIILTNSSRKAESWDGPGWQVIVLPDQIVVNNVTIEQCDDFYDAFLRDPPKDKESLKTGQAQQAQAQIQTQAEVPILSSWTVQAGKTLFSAHLYQHRAAIMICSHRKRDKRCGVTAPILRKEFLRVLRSKDLYGDGAEDVEIWMVSHIGGHKFAGNVIVHRPEGIAVWYGRVEPCHCQAIVEATVEQGTIIRELYRGQMLTW